MCLLELERRLEAAPHVDAQLGVIFQVFDQLHYDGDFATSDTLLHLLDPTKLSSDLIVGVLTITFAAKGHLPERGAFAQRASMLLPKDLLKGLL